MDLDFPTPCNGWAFGQVEKLLHGCSATAARIIPRKIGSLGSVSRRERVAYSMYPFLVILCVIRPGDVGDVVVAVFKQMLGQRLY
jgi:hypothetical protein